MITSSWWGKPVIDSARAAVSAAATLDPQSMTVGQKLALAANRMLTDMGVGVGSPAAPKPAADATIKTRYEMATTLAPSAGVAEAMFSPAEMARVQGTTSVTQALAAATEQYRNLTVGAHVAAPGGEDRVYRGSVSFEEVARKQYAAYGGNYDRGVAEVVAERARRGLTDADVDQDLSKAGVKRPVFLENLRGVAGGAHGQYHPEDGTVGLSKDEPNVKGVLGHELRHGLQKASSGGDAIVNPVMVARSLRTQGVAENHVQEVVEAVDYLGKGEVDPRLPVIRLISKQGDPAAALNSVGIFRPGAKHSEDVVPISTTLPSDVRTLVDVYNALPADAQRYYWDYMVKQMPLLVKNTTRSDGAKRA